MKDGKVHYALRALPKSFLADELMPLDILHCSRWSKYGAIESIQGRVKINKKTFPLLINALGVVGGTGFEPVTPAV